MLVSAVLLTAALQQPPRAPLPPAPAPIVTAAIRGRVVAPAGGAPVANALVSLGGTRRQVYTEANGRFEFAGLAPGTYTLVAGPSAYQKQYLFGPRLEVTVAEGQVVADIELTLARAAVIVGRLVDEAGQPVGGVNVSAATAPNRGSGSSQGSDEFGRFRIFGLSPGSYYLVAQP
jgi:Carboxypeptidase regulatory-like domain